MSLNFNDEILESSTSGSIDIELMEKISANAKLARETIVADNRVIAKQVLDNNRLYKCKKYLKKSLVQISEHHKNKRRKAYKQLKLLYPKLAKHYRDYRNYFDYNLPAHITNFFGNTKKFDAGINYWNTRRTKKWQDKKFASSGRYFTINSRVDDSFNINDVPEMFKWLFNNDD